MKRTILAIGLLAVGVVDANDRYRCTDADGNVTFSRSPCLPAEDPAKVAARKAKREALEQERLEESRRAYELQQKINQITGRNTSSDVEIGTSKWEPAIGMTQAEVERVTQSKDCYKATYKWCGYHRVNRTRTALGTQEQWVWVNVHDMPIWYMYFTNGILTAIQE